MNLYPKNEAPINDALFQNPTSEYRGTPFWAWNCQMTRDKVDMIVDALQEMGMGGGHIHCRTGMNNPYMGEEFLELVRHAHDRFVQRDMLTWLYDEDRWPSGAAGGLVTKEHRYRQRWLVFSPEPLEDGKEHRLLARYQVKLREGWLDDYKRLPLDGTAEPGYDTWFAYLEVAEDNPWYNNQSYVDTLNKAAMDCFIEKTHEVYAKKLGQAFGKTIPAIFTDEPQFRHKTKLNFATDKMPIGLPFTDDVEETFVATYGHSLMDALPELFWEREEEMVSQIRYQYHDHICERFVQASMDNLGAWCKDHDLMLTGHLLNEPELYSQTMSLGEAMRCYRGYQLPGVDMLSDRRELSTVKQAQSAAHQFGRPGVLSELYGVTNWDFDFRGHKLQGDWQAALGVTVRAHHLTWTSMAGEAKRDYPASIGYQSPWYKEYKYIEDYFSRINTAMTRGKPDVKIGVLHPIESYWIYWGAEEKTVAIREEMEENFKLLIQWLLYGFLDFDFISESLLPSQNDLQAITEKGFPVGQMCYDVIIVPNCVTLRSSTLERLKCWQEKGGKLIFAGETPRYLDAVRSREVERFVRESKCIPFTRVNLLNALEEQRTVNVHTRGGKAATNLIYQLRTDGQDKWFFLAHVEKMKDADMPAKEDLVITLNGSYDVICYEPLDGTQKALPTEHKNGKTVIARTMYDHDSLLLRLCPKGSGTAVCEKKVRGETVQLPTENLLDYRLEEPNVMALDQAEYAFDHGPWMPREELLRIDNRFREKLGYQLRMAKFAQPWLTQRSEKACHTLSLRFRFTSELEVENVTLALENTSAKLWFNGLEIPMDITGWYTDRAIATVFLGTVQKGENELLVEIPYRHKENIEYLYLLGQFGVRIQGRESVMTALPERLSFGNLVSQGLPFYGGNIRYQIPLEIPDDGVLRVRVSKFRCPLVKADVDGAEGKVIAFSPYEAELSCHGRKQTLQLTAYGNRVNTFGAIHNCKDTENWFGPNAWRSTDDQWAYEYQLKPTGILKAPQIIWEEKKE